MDPFTAIGLGIGLGFAWFIRELEPLGGTGPANTASRSVNEDAEAVNQPSSCSETPNVKGAAPPVASTAYRFTQLLTDEESEEAAEALRTALGRRR